MAYMYGFDIYYLVLVIPAFLLSLYAQQKVKGTFNKYRTVYGKKGYSGAQAAREILDKNLLAEVKIERVRGNLTDHYDPKSKTVRLSESTHDSRSVAALGVAVHEVGHAIQHKEGYGPLVLRKTLVPVANIGSSAGPYLAMFGLLLNLLQLVYLGIILFAAAVLFYIVTLPVEFDASKRAIAALDSFAILEDNEAEAARKVLNAAALTYVASAAMAMANLLRFILLAQGRRRNQR